MPAVGSGKGSEHVSGWLGGAAFGRSGASDAFLTRSIFNLGGLSGTSQVKEHFGVCEGCTLQR